MPRCNLTLKQKAQLIELSACLSTGELAKKFRVHTTTVTRTIKKKERILCQASRVNPNFKTVQTNLRSEEHDTMVLDYIRSKQGTNIPISVNDICDKAVECANLLGRDIKSRRAWWRRFRIRCNVVRIRVGSQGSQNTSDDEDKQEKMHENGKTETEDDKTSPKKVITLPIINLPDSIHESTKGASMDNCDGGNQSLSVSSHDLPEVSNNIDDKNAKGTVNTGDETSSISLRKISSSKRNRPKKTEKVSKKDKKANKSSVINFTFKIRKTPSKVAPMK